MFQIRYFISIISLLGLAGLFFIFNKTSPMQVGPHGVVAVFILFYLFFLGVIWWLLYLSFFLFSHVIKILSPTKPFRGVSDRTIFYLTSGLSFSPVIIITLMSVSAVQIYDYLLVFLFSILVFVYVFKNRA